MNYNKDTEIVDGAYCDTRCQHITSVILPNQYYLCNLYNEEIKILMCEEECVGNFVSRYLRVEQCLKNFRYYNWEKNK